MTKRKIVDVLTPRLAILRLNKESRGLDTGRASGEDSFSLALAIEAGSSSEGGGDGRSLLAG